MTMRLFILNPAIVFAARVNQASFTYPLGTMTFDGVTEGAYGDIEVGMTVLVGTSAGDDDLGRQRIRLDASANTLYVGRSSQGTHDGELKLEDNAYITVLDDYRVWAKTPYIDEDGNIYKDHDLEVSDRTTTPPPVANAGVGVAGTIDSGTSKLRVTLPHQANSSFAVSGAISSYLWTLPTGVTIVGGYATSDSQIQVDCDPGFYWIKLKVTDSNAHTHEARVPVFARDPASDDTISAFQIARHRITSEGQTLNLTVFETISTFPDGTLVMIWEGEPSAPGDRSHMIFTGWMYEEPVEIAAERTGTLKSVELSLLDVAGKLDKLPGFPQSVEGADSPATWTEMVTPNMDKYLHYLLHWHSTALELADWTWSGTTSSFPFVVLGSDGESLFDQVARRAKALVPDYRLTCNRLGQMAVIVDPIVQAVGSRTATVQAALLEDDWAEINFTHRRVPRVYWLRGSAILAHATDIGAIFCIAAGKSPGQGEQVQESGEQLAQSQADLNSCEGNRYARINAPQSEFAITLADGDDRDIEPANMTWVTLTIANAAAQRGLTLSIARGLISEIDLGYNYRRTGTVKRVKLTWERETSGDADAVTEIPPDPIEDPEWEPPYYPPPPYPGPDITGDLWATEVYVATRELGVFYTSDFVDVVTSIVGTPTWSAVNTGFADLSLYDCYGFRGDPFDPDGRQYCLMEDGLYRRTGGAWSCVLTRAAALVLTGGDDHLSWSRFGDNGLETNINTDGWVGVLFTALDSVSGTKNVLLLSLDYGASWSEKVVRPWSLSGGFHHSLTVGAYKGSSPYDAGKAMYCNGRGDFSHTYLWFSTDGGTTWGYTDLGVSVFYSHILVDPLDQSRVFAGCRVVSSVQHVAVSLDHGQTVNNYDENASGPLGYGTSTCGMYFISVTLTGVVRVGMKVGSYFIHGTWDDGDSWNEPAPQVTGWVNVSIMQTAPDLLYLLRTGPGANGNHENIWASLDEGVTMVAKSGANADIIDTGGGDSIPYNCNGVIAILQL